MLLSVGFALEHVSQHFQHQIKHALNGSSNTTLSNWCIFGLGEDVPNYDLGESIFCLNHGLEILKEKPKHTLNVLVENSEALLV